ncbi:hypothetical protein NKH77_44930 [Streptomyces sp. M19]
MAKKLTEKTLATMDQRYGRNRAWYSMVLAEIHMNDGHIYDACEVARDALPLIAEVSSTRTTTRLADFRKQAEIYKGDPVVRNFLDESASLAA